VSSVFHFLYQRCVHTIASTPESKKKHIFVPVMETTQRYFLKKEHKLKSRKAIDLLFAKGKSFSNFPFRICWQLVTDDVGLKVGFTASSKNFKLATDRNRIKRLMREAYRLQKNGLQEKLNSQGKALHIFFIYTGKEVPQYEIVFEKVGNVLKRMIKFIDDVVE
jgi:ribonuclease P protein component